MPNATACTARISTGGRAGSRLDLRALRPAEGIARRAAAICGLGASCGTRHHVCVRRELGVHSGSMSVKLTIVHNL